MKKITALVVSLLMVCAAFSQKIPEGRNLVAAVYDFAKSENWGGVDSVSYDIQNDTYVLKAYTMGKVLLSFQRQDQTVMYCLSATWTKTTKLIRCIIHNGGHTLWQKESVTARKKNQQ